MWMQFIGFMLYSAGLLFLGVWLGVNEARKRFNKKCDLYAPSLRAARGDTFTPREHG